MNTLKFKKKNIQKNIINVNIIIIATSSLISLLLATQENKSELLTNVAMSVLLLTVSVIFVENQYNNQNGGVNAGEDIIIRID